MFGVSCAPEMYQQVVQQVLHGSEGVVFHNIMDDIIVHASNQKEHDKCLENAVGVLSDNSMSVEYVSSSVFGSCIIGPWCRSC